MMPRRPVRSAFTGLAGSPLAVTEPTPAPIVPPSPAPPPVEPAAAPTPAPKKPGPKPKYASDNERKLAYKRRQAEPERQRMIESLLKKVRSYQLRPSPGIANSTFWKIRIQNREWLASLHTNLNACTYVQIKYYYDVLVSRKAGISDSKGRLPGERSGEESQAGGMSEMESIIAAIESGATTQSVGHGPDEFTVIKSTTDLPDSAPRISRPVPEDWCVAEDRLERAAQLVAEREWGGPRVYEGALCNSLEGLAVHILARYRVGEADNSFMHRSRSLFIGEAAPRFSVGDNRYYREVGVGEYELQKADKAEGVKARKLERLGHTASEIRLPAIC